MALIMAFEAFACDFVTGNQLVNERQKNIIAFHPH